VDALCSTQLEGRDHPKTVEESCSLGESSVEIVDFSFEKASEVFDLKPSIMASALSSIFSDTTTTACGRGVKGEGSEFIADP